jgi:hypothetical protein
MKKLTLFLAITAVLAFGAAQAFGGSTSHRAVAKVTVVMHDPGCHWFSVGGKMKRTLTVKGPARLANFDEAALRIAGNGKVVREKVGGKLVLARGVYRITMVHQAPDDNHLRLTVK